MKTIRVLVGSCVSAVAFVVAGCGNAAKKPVYTTGQTGHVIREERGEIVAVRDVVIKPTDIGILRGGPGRQIGSAVGRAAVTGSVIGAAAAIGGVVGGEIGSKADEKAGEEITIRVAGTEEVVTVVQERGETPLAVGEQVKIQTVGAARNAPAGLGGGNVRVVRAENNFAGARGGEVSRAIERRGTQVVSQ